MSDLISRADAIEVLTETIAPPSVTLDTLVMRIDALPSAETPTLTEKHQLSLETPTDIIRRSDAIEAVENNSYGMGSRASVKAIKSLPSAEPKTGEWVEEDEYSGLWVCDQCGFASEYMDNFCPNCGADMRGGK